MKKLKRAFCFLRCLHRSFCELLDGKPKWIDGHAYKIVYENDDVEILKCKFCGKDNVGYFFNPDEVIK